MAVALAHPAATVEPLSDTALAADLRALAASVDIGVVQVDARTHRYLSVNDAFVAMIGRPRAEILAGTTDALLHPDDGAIRDEFYEAVANHGSAAREVRFVKGDGSDLWVRIHGALATDPDGELRRSIKLIYDLTERRAVEARLRDNDERTSLALRFAGAGTWEYLVASGDMIWSPETFALYEMDPDEPVPRRREWAKMVHPDDIGKITEEHANALTGGSLGSNFRIRRKDGGWRWIGTRAKVLYDDAGAAQRVVGINIDLSDIKQAEAERATAAARWRAAVEATEGIVWTNSPDGRMDGEQPAWAALTGQSRDEYQGFGWSSAIHPDDAQPTIAAWNAAVAARQPFHFEHRIRCADGVWRNFAVRAVPVIDSAGTVAEWVGVHSDVTAVRQAEALLADRVAQAIADRDRAWRNSRDILLIVDTAGVLRAANPAWTATLGWTVAEAIGKPYRDFIAADIADTGQYGLIGVAGQAPPYYENSYRHKDGSTRTISWTVQPEGDSLFASGRDVTAERLREAELAKATVERDRAWANSRDILLVIGPDGVVQSASPAWTEILGWSQDELVGHRFSEFLVPGDVARTDAGFEVAKREPLPSFVNMYRHKDGSTRTISWLTTNEDGLVYTSGRDITAELQRQAELERAQAQVHELQKLEAIGQLTGGVAHDFNNLLTPIIGGLDMLQRRLGNADDKIGRLIDGALSSADRAKTLVQRLLAFARRQQLETRAVDLIALVDNMRGLIEQSVGPQVKLKLVHENTLPPVRVDPAQLELALLNLAINARDAMPGGGKLTIAMARSSASGRGQLAKGDYVRLAVVDTGTGMDAATLRRAIEPFFSTKGLGRGTGLGLSMVHGLAAQFGGRLTIASAPRIGTRAEVWLPVFDGVSAAGRPVAPPAAVAPYRRERILLVDDEAVVRETTTEMLTDLGLDVTAADGPEAALELLQNGASFDAMVTDFLMPGLNGGELIAAARRHQPGLPAMIITGFTDTDTLPPGLTRLAKPFRQADLAKAIAVLLEKSA